MAAWKLWRHLSKRRHWYRIDCTVQWQSVHRTCVHCCPQDSPPRYLRRPSRSLSTLVLFIVWVTRVGMLCHETPPVDLTHNTVFESADCCALVILYNCTALYYCLLWWVGLTKAFLTIYVSSNKCAKLYKPCELSRGNFKNVYFRKFKLSIRWSPCFHDPNHHSNYELN